jgi:hypothetical protein
VSLGPAMSAEVIPLAAPDEQAERERRYFEYREPERRLVKWRTLMTQLYAAEVDRYCGEECATFRTAAECLGAYLAPMLKLLSRQKVDDLAFQIAALAAVDRLFGGMRDGRARQRSE